jgi:hypothetical protein
MTSTTEFIFLLLFGLSLGNWPIAKATEFQFTSPSYNLSIAENSIAGTIASIDNNYGGESRSQYSLQSYDAGQRMGVLLPKGYHQVNFRIVEVGQDLKFELAAFNFI